MYYGSSVSSGGYRISWIWSCLLSPNPLSFCSPVDRYHCLKKMGKGQPHNSVPIHLCFEIAKGPIKEDFSDQKELRPCRERQRLDYWRNRSSFLTYKGETRASLTQKPFSSPLVGKDTLLLPFYDAPGALRRDRSCEILFCFHKNVHPLSVSYFFQTSFLSRKGPYR